jgi:hypothetical protein
MKPKFDPSKPFEAASGKPKFDPAQPFEAPRDYEAEATLAADKKFEETKPDMLEAVKLGLTQGTLRNFGDELAGLKGGEGAKANLQDRVKRSKEEQPLAYMAGEVGSKIATLPATLNPFGAAAIAAGDTAVSGLGDDKSAKQIATESAVGGLTAGAMTKIMPALMSKLGEYGDDGMKWLASKLQTRADNQTIKALGGTQGQIQKLGDKAPAVAKHARENLLSPFASSQEIAEKAATMGDDLAQQTKPIYQAAENSSVSTGEMLKRVDDMIDQLKGNPANAPIINKLRGYQEAMKDAAAPGFNPSELREFRQGVAKTVNFNSDAPSQLASKNMYGLIRDAEMDQIAKIDPKLMLQNEDLFRKLHLNSLAEDMAEKGAARSTSNNDIGLNTWLAMDMAADLGTGGLKTALVGAGREMVRRFGPQMEGLGLTKVAETIGGTKFEPLFVKAAERGPQAIVALHQALRSNPEYQALMGD